MWAIAKQKMNQDRKLPVWQRLIGLAMAIVLMFCLTACGGDRPVASKAIKAKKIETASISEVSPPSEIQRLNQTFDRYEPQLNIVSPQPDTILQEDKVTVQLSVTDLPIFKSSLGLGPHVHVTLDGQEYKPLYNLSESLTFESLTPGTHTIRAFASRPWHESFKNEGAYAQVTFHVYAKTGENTPNPQLPLLTYSRPVGTYGAEPILLDFYLRNAPLHIAALEDSDISDWQIRATVNGQSFLMENWQPLYLKGFKPGQNWVKLEFLDCSGNLVANQFNSTVHLIDYQPGGQDALARLMRGEKIVDVDKIVDLNYVAPSETAPLPKVESAPPVTTAPTAPATPQVIKSEPIAPEPPAEPVAPIQPQPSATSAPVETQRSPSVTKSEPATVVPIPVPLAPLPVPVIKQPEVPPVPVNKLPEKLPEQPSVVSPQPAPAIASPKPEKPKPEKVKEKGERPSFQKMFDRFKEKVAPKQAEKIAPKLPTAVPAIKPEEKPSAPKLEPMPDKLAPATKVEPEVTPVPAQPKPKAKAEEKRDRPSFQKMFDRFKEKVAPKQVEKITPKVTAPAPAIKPVEKPEAPQPEATTTKELTPAIKVEPKANPAIASPKPEKPKPEKVKEKGDRPSFQKMFDQLKEKVAPKQVEKIAPKLPTAVPAIEPAEKSSAPKLEATPDKLAPATKVEPKVNPVPTQPKPKAEEKRDRPSFQKMFDQLKEKVAPKPASPSKVVPKQVEEVKENAPKPAVTNDRLAPSVPPKQAPVPVIAPKVEEAKSEATKESANTPPPTNWKERLRQLRQNSEGSKGQDSSAPKPAGGISIPESL